MSNTEQSFDIFDLAGRIYMFKMNNGGALPILKLLAVRGGFLISINFHTLA